MEVRRATNDMKHQHAMKAFQLLPPQLHQMKPVTLTPVHPSAMESGVASCHSAR